MVERIVCNCFLVCLVHVYSKVMPAGLNRLLRCVSMEVRGFVDRGVSGVCRYIRFFRQE